MKMDCILQTTTSYKKMLHSANDIHKLLFLFTPLSQHCVGDRSAAVADTKITSVFISYALLGSPAR